MPVIAGIDGETKEKLIEYCKRNWLTQVEWVVNHLYADLKAEEERRGFDAGYSDMPPLPAAAGSERENSGPD